MKVVETNKQHSTFSLLLCHSKKLQYTWLFNSATITLHRRWHIIPNICLSPVLTSTTNMDVSLQCTK